MSSETTKATHTPGPWTLTETTREDRLGNKSPCWLVDGDPIYPEWVNPKDVHAEDYRTRVCEVFPPFYSEVAGHEKRISKSHQETRANARLIAAAPALLEACRVALSHYRMFRDSSLVGETERDDIASVEAAIASATL